MESALIRNAIDKARGNVAQAAQALGIARAAFEDARRVTRTLPKYHAQPGQRPADQDEPAVGVLEE